MDIHETIMDFLKETDYEAIRLLFRAAATAKPAGEHQLYRHVGQVTIDINPEFTGDEDILAIQENEVNFYYDGAWHDILDLTTEEALKVLSYMIE